MLQLTAEQWMKIEILGALGFTDDLLKAMVKSHPASFAGLPPYVRRAMILNGITSAEDCGFYLRSSYATFIALQCHAAPNFYLHPEIDAILHSGLPEQERIDAIRAVPEQTWAEIQAAADPGAWFEPRLPDQLAIRAAARVCATFQGIVKDNPEKAISTFFNSAVARAADHGIDWDEGIALYAAALFLYGPHMDRPGGPRWASQVFLPSPLSGPKIANLLRTRIALDTDRML